MSDAGGSAGDDEDSALQGWQVCFGEGGARGEELGEGKSHDGAYSCAEQDAVSKERLAREATILVRC